MARRRRSFFFDNINRRLLTDTFKNTFQSKAEADSNVTSDSDVMTKAKVDLAVAGIINAAPTTLDTLNELAAALGDDPNFATTVTNSIATKLNASAVSSFGLTLVDDADAATARTTLGLGTAATTASTVVWPIKPEV